MSFKINENFGALKQNYLFSEVGKRVRAYKAEHPASDVISLGIGDVTLPLPSAVISAMKKAVDEMANKATFRGYAPEYGYDFLQSAISGHYRKRGVKLDIGEIFVSDGAKCDLGNLMDILGDNPVLVPDPVYPVYVDANIMSGRQATLMEGNEANGFLPTPEGIEKKSHVIYICSPNNPTGAVYSRSGLKEWVDFANETGSLIIFDSAYESFIREDAPHSIYEIEGAEQCAIEVCSLSKTAGFTGVRCGWTVIPTELAGDGGVSVNGLWKRRQATKFNGVSYTVQRAAEAVFTPEGYVQCMKNIDTYLENARLLGQLLTDKGIRYFGGRSSPYLWLKCPDDMGSWEFFDLLLNKIEIVGTPGEGFGKCGEGYFRLTSFASPENTLRAIERLKTIL